MRKISNPNYLQAELLWAQLAAVGVRHVVISPGSRSTPLARTALLSKKLSCHIVIDERSAGFFALGLAKGSGVPAALVCTSGTAAAHYYPAVIEAAQSGYPLVVVTADRPQQLRNSGAMQTIDQTALFGRYAKMFLELSAPKSDASAMRETLGWIRRALSAMLTAPVGPIQINVPMDEPLVPVEVDSDVCASVFEEVARDVSPIESGGATLVEPHDKIVSLIENCFCGLIVCGADAARTKSERDAIYELARKLGWPLLADVSSGLRFCGEPNMPFYDIFLRHESLAQLAPDLVLEFGMTPVSKSLTQYLNRHRAKTIRVQRDSLPRDPERRASDTIVADVAEYCGALVQRSKVSRDSLLLDPFWKAAGVTRSHADRFCTNRDAELSYAKFALESAPDGGNIVLASSMPIRYADMLAVPAGKKLNVFAQRGTNGIDGVLSHAAGVALSTGRPTLLICGDLAFLHDLGGLHVARRANSLRVLMLNNNGGGIFSFLPVADYADTFEPLHGTPTDVKLSAATSLFDIYWSQCAAPEDCGRELNWDSDEPMVLEVHCNRERNSAAHSKIVQDFLHALESC